MVTSRAPQLSRMQALGRQPPVKEQLDVAIDPAARIFEGLGPCAINCEFNRPLTLIPVRVERGSSTLGDAVTAAKEYLERVKGDANETTQTESGIPRVELIRRIREKKAQLGKRIEEEMRARGQMQTEIAARKAEFLKRLDDMQRATRARLQREDSSGQALIDIAAADEQRVAETPDGKARYRVARGPLRESQRGGRASYMGEEEVYSEPSLSGLSDSALTESQLLKRKLQEHEEANRALREELAELLDPEERELETARSKGVKFDFDARRRKLQGARSGPRAVMTAFRRNLDRIREVARGLGPIPKPCGCPHADMEPLDARWPEACAVNCYLHDNAAEWERLMTRTLAAKGVDVKNLPGGTM
ncbi:unnamed protein product [Pedinophyceae sp. YPF-701]|nr:unnamed protein product [Pedinophyceae sp. YPF-701]